jgi:hypothetical protein
VGFEGLSTGLIFPLGKPVGRAMDALDACFINLESVIGLRDTPRVGLYFFWDDLNKECVYEKKFKYSVIC